MSDIQQYLLRVDNDRAGAEQVAERTAQSRHTPGRPSLEGLELT